MNNHIAFLNDESTHQLRKSESTIESLKSICSEMDSLIGVLWPGCNKPSVIDCCEHVFDKPIDVDNAKNTLKYYFSGIRYVLDDLIKNIDISIDKLSDVAEDICYEIEWVYQLSQYFSIRKTRRLVLQQINYET